VVYTNSGIILYGNKNLSGKAVLVSNSAILFMSLFLEIFVARIPVLMYCIFIYIKFHTNYLLSYPVDILIVKLADQISNYGKRCHCAKCDKHKAVRFTPKNKNSKYANRSYITLYRSQ
jgi:hypothetical protein